MRNLTIAIVSILSILSSATYAQGQVCAEVKVEGEDCASLRVVFDLSHCDEQVQSRVAKASCKKDHATAEVDGALGRYRAALGLRSGWGKSEWAVDDVSFAPKITHEKVSKNKSAPRKVASEAVAASAAPAGNKELPALPAAPAAPATDAWTALGISFGATFDAYYSYNFNTPASVNVPTITGSSSNFAPVNAVPAPNTQMRYYDAYANQFALNLAELSVRKTKGEVGFTLDLDFGLMADLNSTDEVGKHIGQAFVTYNPAWLPGLTIDFGKMPTHLGYELIKGKDNWQYSRSTTFGFGSPFWNNGVHIGYALRPELTIGGYINNTSVNNGFYSLSAKKSLGLQVKWVPNPNFSLIYNVVSGGRDSLTVENDITIHEANIVYTANPNLAFALEMLAGRDENPPGYATSEWFGATLHAKYKAGSWYSLSPRLEWFNDTTGYRTAVAGGHALLGATLTNSFQISPELETRLEFRVDQSNRPVFTKGDGTTTPTQATVTFAILYSFGS
jgi:hypothetical protein